MCDIPKTGKMKLVRVKQQEKVKVKKKKKKLDDQVKKLLYFFADLKQHKLNYETQF